MLGETESSTRIRVSVGGRGFPPTNMSMLARIHGGLINCVSRTRGLRTGSVLESRKNVRRDVKRRGCVAEHADRQLMMKALLYYRFIPDMGKHLASLPRDSHVSRVRSRCVLTGRGRGVLTRFRISRIKFHQIADQGRIPGVTRSSW